LADVVVSEADAGEAGDSTAALSAHEAAVAEGATAVQAELAGEAAEEAVAAAEVALAAAEANIEAGMAVEAGVSSAAESAAVATVSADMVHEALQAQTAAIQALADELRRSREAEPKPRASHSEPEQAPARKAPWYYRQLGGGR
jgi:hypothetical protein